MQIAHEARAARSCPLSRSLAALEKFDATIHTSGHQSAPNGALNPLSTISPALVDSIHRAVTDAGRVADSDEYYERLVPAMMEAGTYIEMVAIVATLTQVLLLHYSTTPPMLL
jgi:hypothetical protein